MGIVKTCLYLQIIFISKFYFEKIKDLSTNSKS